ERKANVDKEKALSDSQRDLNSLIGQIRGMENDKRMLEQKQQFLEQNMHKSNLDIQAATGRVTQLENDLEHYRSELNLAKREEARLEEELETAEDNLKKVQESHGSIKAELDDIVNSQQEAERALFSLEKQKAVNLNEIDNYQRLIEQNKLDIEVRMEEVSSLKAQIEAIQKQEEGKRIALENLEKAEEGRLENIRLAEKELETLQKNMTRVNRELDAKRNEFKLTQSMIENLEGFPESIRFLSGNKEWSQEKPLLSDILYVKEEYRIAIENYLEPYLNYYVVENLEEAQQAIRLLSNSQKGKANFFLLDAFTNYEAPMKMLPGTQHAIDLVETDMNYRRLCGYLLENVLITDNEHFDLKDIEEDVTILSKSGSFIRRKFSVSGGSVGLFEGKKIGRKKNLEVLEGSIKKLEREENRHSTAFYNLKSKIENLKTGNNNPEIHRERNALNQLTQERVSLSTRLENFQTFIAEADEKFRKSDQAIKNLQASNTAIDKDLENKMGIVSGVKEQIANMDGSYREVAEELSLASANFNQKNIAFIQQQNKVGAFQREVVFREKQLEETLASMDSNQRQLKENSEEIKQIQVQADELQQGLLVKYEERKGKESSLTEAEQLYFSARGGINEIEDDLRQTGRARQDAQVLINQLKEKFTDLKFQVSSVAQRLKIEFEMEINDIINQEPENPMQDPEELEIKVDRMRRRLENYGEINPMAVEAYNEMKERFDTITKQRDDIIEAKDSLIATIKEIEETATVQFLDSFSKARLYFIDVFRSLFTEDDNCDLLLLEPDNPLESKIEIVAKPKGKRPQTISQLSGGEKTLTAIALLFALYLLKPAPFCIFDEVDAPLDDANILKFNKIIKKFSSESQFIIVTHNKLTMASVDTIYGVYMAEQGVSGVSPVDFRDFEHKATFEVSR
ncbi:MAG: chromosome segregation protein SMC, partial [Bacteroidetes bacterium]